MCICRYRTHLYGLNPIHSMTRKGIRPKPEVIRSFNRNHLRLYGIYRRTTSNHSHPDFLAFSARSHGTTAET